LPSRLVLLPGALVGNGANREIGVPMRLLAITSRHLAGGVAALERRCGELLDAGVPAIMLREKDLTGAELLLLAMRLREATRERGALLIVNGAPGVAADVGADGVHIGGGPQAFAAAMGRGIAVPMAGASCHSRADLISAESNGAVYALLSPFFDPSSKKAARPPLGAVGFRAESSGIAIPVLALGGITAENVPEALAAGAAGVAAIGAFFSPDATMESVRRLIGLLSQ